MRTANPESPTRDKLLDAAQDLMLAKGFTATSVDEICDAAGVTKGSFFHYFDGKEELGRVLAERFFKSMRQRFATAPHRQKKDPLDRIHGFLDMVVGRGRTAGAGKGCLLGTFVQELFETHPGIRDVCADCFAEQAAFLAADFAEAKAKYVPKARWDPRSMAEHLIAVIQGSIILAKAKQDAKPLEENARHFREYLKFVCAQ